MEQIVGTVKQHEPGTSAADICRKLGIAEGSVPQRKAMARYLLDHHGVSLRRACRIARPPRKMFTYVSKRPPQEALRQRIVELARARVRHGYRRIHVLLMRKGIHVNKRRVHRLYCLEGLQLRAKRPRRNVSAAARQPPKALPKAPDLAWSVDFVADQTSRGVRCGG